MTPPEIPRAMRYSMPLHLQYRQSANASWVSGRTENISASGVLFVVDEVLAVNTLITMTLVMPAELVGGAGASVTCVGKVVRVLPPARHGRPAMAASITKYRLLPGEQGIV
jgi:hypothetical protein